jgi:hypothetical protein
MTMKEPGMNGVAAPAPPPKMRLRQRNTDIAFNSTFLNMNLRFLIINVQRKEKPKTLADYRN